MGCAEMGRTGLDGNRDDRPVALVLGAAVWAGGQASPSLRRRAEKGAELWLDGHVRAIVACGGEGRHPPSEAEMIRRICIGRGVPDAAILCEDRSTTTEENLRFALPFLRRLGTDRVVVVTDRFHLPRSGLVARRLGLSATGASPDVPGPLTLRRVGLWLREILAFAGYALSGKGRRDRVRDRR